jgi:hypothetical protein
MTNVNIDQIGAEAARLWAESENSRKLAQPFIKQVWDAYTAAEEAGTPIIINGAPSKTAWAKQSKISIRYCQMIAKDGSRKRDANRVRAMALLKELITVVATGSPKECIDKASAICGQIKWFPKAWTDEMEEPQKPLKKKKEEKKPLKHAKNPKTYTAWCGTEIKHNHKLVAHQTRYATCPYCIAAIKADIPVTHPEMWRRYVEKELKEAREYLTRHESVVKNCPPEDRDKKQSGYQHNVEAVAEYRKEIAKWEQELAAIKEITTPEQAVKAALAAKAQREAERKAEATEAVERATTEAQAERDAEKKNPAVEAIEKTLDATNAEQIAVPEGLRIRFVMLGSYCQVAKVW